MEGRHFCVSFVDGRDLSWCLDHGASVMMDNGAFSIWTQGNKPNWKAFYQWVEPHLGHPHWAVIPDSIEGEEEENDSLLLGNPYPKEYMAPVWHMHESIARLERLVNEWPRICIGSSGEYRRIGTEEWVRRIDDAWKAILPQNKKPWVHMLRAMAAASKGGWPFASADSTNIARNHKGSKQQRRQDVLEMVRRIDGQNPIIKGVKR